MKKLLLFLSLFFISLNAAKPQTPGSHKRIPCDNNKNWSFDVYIPKAYEAKPKKKFPVLYLSSPSKYPGFRGLENWAEKREFLLICINDTKNNIKWTKIQNETLKSTDYLRKHHSLQFSTGLSGGAMASAHLAKNHPEKFAGVLLQAHSGNHVYPPKHIYMTFLYSDNDKVHGPSYVENAMKHLKKQGNHVKGKQLSVGHTWMPKNECIIMLNTMYDYQRFNHKNLTKDDLKEAWDDFALHSAPLFKKEHSEERTAELHELLNTPKILKQKIGRKVLRYWGRAVTKDLKSLKKKPRTAYKLIVENSHYLSKLKGKTKKSYLKAIKPIISHKKNRKEVESLARYEALYKREKKIKDDDQDAKETLVRKYQAILRKHPKALVAPKVKEAIKRLQH